MAGMVERRGLRDSLGVRLCLSPLGQRSHELHGVFMASFMQGVENGHHMQSGTVDGCWLYLAMTVNKIGTLPIE